MQQFADFMARVNQHPPLSAADAQAHLDSARAESQRQWAEEFRNGQRGRMGIPAVHAKSRLGNWRATSAEQISALNSAKSFVANFPRIRTEGLNLILSGSTGTGKTHLICAIAQAVAELGFRVRYTTAADLVSDIRETWGSSDRSERGVIAGFIAADLLLVDEIGATTASKDEVRLLERVFAGRYDDERPSVLASNLEPAGLGVALGDRAYSRVAGKGREVIMKWADHRLSGGRE